MMLVQPVKFEEMSEDMETQQKLTIPSKVQKRDVASPQTSVQSYHTIRRVNPLPHPEYNIELNDGTQLQTNRGFVHAIIRKMPSDVFSDATVQMIGAYSGFQASLEDRQQRNKAYYFFTHAQPPNKTVVNEMMQRSVEAAEFPLFNLLETNLCTH